MAIEKKLDPTSLVARIVAELQANPEAQQLLLRTLLTNEFLGVPARLDRIEKDVAELKVDVAHLKADMAEAKADIAVLKTDMAEAKADIAVLKTDMAEVKTDVASLKGSDLENRLHRKIRALASQKLKLKKTRIVQGPVHDPTSDFLDDIEAAVQDGRLTEKQESRIVATDFILHAQRRADRAPVWVAVEASNIVDGHDINRVRASADALRAVFRTQAVAVAAGYGIGAADAERAEAARVKYLQVSPPRQV